MSGRTRAASLLAAVVTPLTLVAAGCAKMTHGTSAAPPSQPSMSSAPPVASSSPPAPSQTPATAPCRTAELKVSLGTGGVAAGMWAALLEFTNQGATACTVTGWPAVAGITSAGSSTPATNRPGAMDGLNNPGTPQLTLEPGQQAGADVSGVDASANGSCSTQFSSLRVSAPGDSASVTVSAYLASLSGNLPSCGTLAVSAVHPLSDFSFSGQ